MKSNPDEFWIDEAIESYPLETLPDGFVAHVMANIEPRPSERVKLGWDVNSRILFYTAPLAIFGFSLTAALLVQFSPVWMGSAQASYFHSMLEYWWLQLAYSGLPLHQLGVLAMVMAVAGGFAVLWQLTDPARKLRY